MSYHITIDGTPLCQCEGHLSGLLSEAWYDRDGHRLCCEYRDAKRAQVAASRVQQLKPGRLVKATPGSCPAYQASRTA